MAHWALRPFYLIPVQYISCLMYQKSQNPIFAPYTPEQGGGPPCLWAFDGYLYESRWQEPNILFLQNLLETPKNVTEVVTKAVDCLTTHCEYATAQKLLTDLPDCTETLAERCKSLPYALATIGSRHAFDWLDL